MVIDYWCNLFTPEGIRKCFLEAPELKEAFDWLRIEDHLKGYEVEDFLARMDRAGVERLLVPAAKMRSWKTQSMIWDLSVEEVAQVASRAPSRIGGLCGINPFERMDGVRRLERAVREHHFVGAHLHPYGFGLPLSDAAYYPYYAKCAELDVPIVIQVGHTAELMPNDVARPLLLDPVALYFPELRIVAAHTGWPWVEELVALAWKHRNLFIGTSAHAPKYWDPKLVQFIQSRGQDKVLYGSDFPVLLHEESLAQVRALGLKPQVEAKLLSENARRVFRFSKE